MNNLFIFSSKFKYPNPRPKISEPEPKIPEPDSKCRNTPTGSIPNIRYKPERVSEHSPL